MTSCVFALVWVAVTAPWRGSSSKAVPLHHSEGCEWDSRVLDVSANKLELFQWAAEHDCPGEAHTVCTEVTKGGSVPVLIKRPHNS
eukprot:13973-Heterococcus_DN1.PRE.2